MMYISNLKVKNFGNIADFDYTFEPHGSNIVEIRPEEYEDMILAIKEILSIYIKADLFIDFAETIDTAFGSCGELCATFKRDDDVISLKVYVTQIDQEEKWYHYVISINDMVLPQNISRAIWDSVCNYLYPEGLRNALLYRYSGKEEDTTDFWPIIKGALDFESSNVWNQEKERVFLPGHNLVVPRDEIYFNELKNFINQNRYSFLDKGKDLVRFLYTGFSQRTIARKSEYYGPHPLVIADIDDLLDNPSLMPPEAKDFLFAEDGLVFKKGLRQYIILKKK